MVPVQRYQPVHQVLYTSVRVLSTECAHRKWLVAVDDEPNHLPREWLDAVHVGNDAPRTLLAPGPATAAAFATRPTGVMFFQGLAIPIPIRVEMLPQMGRGPKPNLGIAEITVRLEKLARGYARERVFHVDHERLPQRVVGSDRLVAPLLMLHAVEHRLAVARTCQGNPRAAGGHNFADGISRPQRRHWLRQG